MRLTGRPPETVEVGGRPYPINTDFRAGIEFEQAIVSGNADAARLLTLYYPAGIPADIDGAVGAMLWFYACGEEPRHAGEDGRRPPQKANREYDFDQDADALYASFQATYGIDLTTAGIHWWVFRSLMFGLPPGTPFMQRVYYRTADTAGMSKEQKRHVLEMRKRYELNRPYAGEAVTLEERTRRFAEVQNAEG